MKGGCHCGAIRYETRRAPSYSGFCHCRDCQRITGTGHCCYMIFDRSDVAATGSCRSYQTVAASGNITVRHFCDTCGSQIFGSGAPGDPRLTIYAGTLDDLSEFTPTEAVFARSRPEWDRAAMALAECEALPD